MQDFVGLASSNTVLVSIDVAVVADLALSVDTAESFEAETSIGSSAVNFVETRAAVNTDSVTVHYQARIANTALLCNVVGCTDWAGHTISILDEERYRTDVADALEDTVSRFALALSGLGVNDSVDSASGNAALLGFDPELTRRTTTAIISVVCESWVAHALASSVSLTVRLASDACHADAV